MNINFIANNSKKAEYFFVQIWLSYPIFKRNLNFAQTSKRRIFLIKKLHPRNKHLNGYDFDLLILGTPKLKGFVHINPYGIQTIDFADPEAVKALNKALLKTYYGLNYWDIPANNLCPPVPGRADYIHYIADVLATENQGNVPYGPAISLLDIGVGANCIYPIIGNREYGWRFVGTDIDPKSVANARKIVEKSHILGSDIAIRLQSNPKNILKNVIQDGDYFHFVICNPPFFSSHQEALENTRKKIKNLGKAANKKPVQNFGGQNNELWCPGGEKTFISKLIFESQTYQHQCLWFSSLVSQKENLKPLQSLLNKLEAKDVRIIPMEQGNKISRILVWKF